jgi:hypothetical protein
MTPLFKKLNFKIQDPVLVVNAPESFEKETDQLLPFTTILNDPELVATCSFIIAFVTQQAEVDALAFLLSKKLEGDGILWFCYPKGSSKKYKCNFNRDTGWNALAKEGFEGVRMVAVDEDWSALRFRKVQYIKTMTRSFARTDAGKEKSAKGK